MELAARDRAHEVRNRPLAFDDVGRAGRLPCGQGCQRRSSGLTSCPVRMALRATSTCSAGLAATWRCPPHLSGDRRALGLQPGAGRKAVVPATMTASSRKTIRLLFMRPCLRQCWISDAATHRRRPRPPAIGQAATQTGADRRACGPARSGPIGAPASAATPSTPPTSAVTTGNPRSGRGRRTGWQQPATSHRHRQRAGGEGRGPCAEQERPHRPARGRRW